MLNQPECLSMAEFVAGELFFQALLFSYNILFLIFLIHHAVRINTLRGLIHSLFLPGPAAQAKPCLVLKYTYNSTDV